MEGEENHGLTPMPVISRLDRLDQLLHYLEEKQSASMTNSDDNSPTASSSTNGKPESRSLASVLEEVPLKGSLLERVAVLEHRVLQLSIEIEKGDRQNSCSTMPAPECGKQASVLEETSESSNCKQDAESTIRGNPVGKKSSSKKTAARSYRRWLGWLKMGC